MKRKGILITSLCLSVMTLSFLIGTKSSNHAVALTPIETPNAIAKEANPAYVPTDEYYSSQQGISMNHIGNIEDVWDYYKGDEIRVAVIDSGFDFDHPDFTDDNGRNVFSLSEGKMFSHATPVSGKAGYYTIDPNNADGATTTVYPFVPQAQGYGYYINDVWYPQCNFLKPMSGIKKFNNHGTDVSSTIASAIHTTTNKGTVGIAPKITIIPIKVDFWTDCVYEALSYVETLNKNESTHIDVVNMSIEGPDYKDIYNNSLFDQKISSLINKKTIVVAAAGNSNTDAASYPASNTGVIGVGALARNSGTEKASFSNYNALNHTSSSNNNVDVVAPGYVYTATWDGSNAPYHETQGTSFSSPIIAGAAALWKEANPGGTVQQFKTALYTTTDDIGVSGWDTTFGYGRINISRLLGVSDDSPTVSSVSVSPASITLDLNGTKNAQLQATVLGTNNPSQSVTWTSGNSSKVEVTSSGYITAKAVGSNISISATSVLDGTKSGSCVVNVIDSTVSVTGVSLNKNSTTIIPGGSETLTATIEPNNATNKNVTWTSSNNDVATVSGGVVSVKSTATAGQTSTITVTTVDGSYTATCTVTVGTPSAPTNATEYSLINSAEDLEVGKSYLIASAVSSNSIKTLSTSPQTNNIPTTSLSVSSNKVTRGSSAMSVTLGGSSGAYTFLTNNCSSTNGYLNATNTTGSNYLRVVSDLDSYAYFSISFSGDAAVITCTGKSSRNIIRYNSTNNPPIFSCYSSGSNPVYLWKEITVKTLSSISVETSPKTSYEAGEKFDPSGLVIRRTYSDASYDTYSYDDHPSEFSFNPTTSTLLKTTDTNIEITYDSKKCDQAITVVKGVELSSITVSGYTTSFVEGDTFSFGGTVTAHFDNSTSSVVTNSATFSGYSMTTLGNQTVTVSYTDKGITKTTSYDINVGMGSLNSISVNGQTTTFVKNNPFVFNGTCIAAFANGYQKEVTPTSVTSPDMSIAGVKTITVSFTYNGKTETTSYEITVNSNRVVIETTTTPQYSVVGTVTWPSSATPTINPSSSVNVSTSGYTTFESASLRLGSGSNTGTITVSTSTAKITKVVVSAKTYSGDTSVNITIGGSSYGISSSYNEYIKEFSTATNSVAIATTASKKRAHIQSITIYETKNVTVETDISTSSDCLGLEEFITTYMHMDYIQNLGYCKDSEHHYYSSARDAFNVLNAHQRSLFVGNTAYSDEFARLSAWAGFNGESFNGNNQLSSLNIDKSSVVIDTPITTVILASVVGLTALGGYIFIRRRKEN